MPRPRTPLLDLDRITAAALELSDDQGSFTIAELADRLGVHPSSLYHHVAGRDEVIDLMRSRIGRTIDVAGFGVVPWDEALERLAWSYRSAFAKHAGSIRTLATSRVRDEISLQAYERIATALVSAGFSSADVLPVIAAVDNFVLGSALDAAGDGSLYAPKADRHPHLSAALEAFGEAGSDNLAERTFAVGLTALIEGLRSLTSGPVSISAGGAR